MIQKYLRNKFQTIEEYNREAHETAEAYRVLVVFDFPANFTEETARRLLSIVQNGPRCGVYTIILQDAMKNPPYKFGAERLHQSTRRVECINGRVTLSKDRTGMAPEFFSFQFEEPCPEPLLTRIIEETGKAARENMTVVVPYAKVLALGGIDPENSQGWWTASSHTHGKDVSAADLIQIPLGPSGARKAQLLTLGVGTAHHAVIAGRIGSGKSNLLNIMITTLALKYSPEEVELYLIDFKNGVEFKPYAKHLLPHARVIAIESEREFGLSVLEGLDREMDRRGKAFRSSSDRKIDTFREESGGVLARIVLIVDEFQEFFREDDKIAREAAKILDHLVRQGRGFGIHVVLASQSLAGSYTLARSTLDQMQIRIALQCSEADSRLILADDNPAARRLSRPGEAIYNASSGLIEGNQLFQVALLSDQERDHYLDAIRRNAAAGAGRVHRPIIFEGHEPAQAEFCQPLVDLLAGEDWPPPGKSAEVWIGEPVSLKPPTSLVFRRQSGSNLLVVSRDEEESVGVLIACVLGLTAQQRPNATRVHIVDFATADAPWSDVAGILADLFPVGMVEALGRRDLPALLEGLTAAIARRLEQGRSAKTRSDYLIIQGLHRARDLRSDPAQQYRFGEEGASKPTLPQQFATILRDGPEAGVHTLVWCDTFAALDRTLERGTLGEFGYRVAGAMTSEDSNRLLDDGAASRLDRPYRMIKLDEDRPGILETFRPYRVPTTPWLEQVAEKLRSRVKGE